MRVSCLKNKWQQERMSCLKINYKGKEAKRVKGEQDTSVCWKKKARMFWLSFFATTKTKEVILNVKYNKQSSTQHHLQTQPPTICSVWGPTHNILYHCSGKVLHLAEFSRHLWSHATGAAVCVSNESWGEVCLASKKEKPPRSQLLWSPSS